MSIMLNESNSSFDTTPSIDFLLSQDNGQGDEVLVSDVDNEDEGYHVVGSESNHRENVGVLIVPPTTGSSENSRNTILSIPESVPTVMNSAILDLPNSVHVLEDDRASSTEVNSARVNTIEGLDRESSPLLVRSFHDDCSVSLNGWRRNVLTVLFFATITTCCACHALYLHRESQLLKEQVRLLTDQAARSAATLEELKQKQDREVVFDNCWLEARAKMSFGECSQEAKESVKAQVNTIGSSVNQFWGRMKKAYEENLKLSVFGMFNVAGTANKTEDTLGTTFSSFWYQMKEMGGVKIKQQVNRINIGVQDLWNQTKGTMFTSNSSDPVNALNSTIQVLWDEMKDIYHENVQDQLQFAGRSLDEASSTLVDRLKRGYNDVKDSINVGIVYANTGPPKSNTTSAEHTTETNVTEYFVHGANGLQSLSKKVLVAAAWSAGVAILVSTFDMYWHQQGNVLALKN